MIRKQADVIVGSRSFPVFDSSGEMIRRPARTKHSPYMVLLVTRDFHLTTTKTFWKKAFPYMGFLVTRDFHPVKTKTFLEEKLSLIWAFSSLGIPPGEDGRSFCDKGGWPRLLLFTVFLYIESYLLVVRSDGRIAFLRREKVFPGIFLAHLVFRGARNLAGIFKELKIDDLAASPGFRIGSHESGGSWKTLL